MQVTRTFKRFTVKIAVLDADMAVKVLYEGEVVAPHLTKADARSIAKDATGLEMPRGAIVSIVELGQETYACELADFMAVARLAE